MPLARIRLRRQSEKQNSEQLIRCPVLVQFEFFLPEKAATYQVEVIQHIEVN